MRREAIREGKEAEKAKKAAEREEKRVDQILQKQSKQLIALERKNKLQKHKKEAAAVAVVRASETGSESVITGPSKPPKKAAKSRENVIFTATKPVRRGPAIKRLSAAAGPATVAVATEEAQKRSRSGRTVALLQRPKGYGPSRTCVSYYPNLVICLFSAQ